MKSKEKYKIGITEVEVWDDCIVTIFSDGATVIAGDNHNLADAERYGYETDTFQMSVDHEIAHTWIAWVTGCGFSRVLWDQAHNVPHGVWASWEEEVVLTFQSGLDKTKPRPWERWSVGG